MRYSILLAAAILAKDASSLVLVDEGTAQVAFKLESNIAEKIESSQPFDISPKEEQQQQEEIFVDSDESTSSWITSFNRELTFSLRRHHDLKDYKFKDHKKHKERKKHKEHKTIVHKGDYDPFAPPKHVHKKIEGEKCSMMDYIRRKPGCGIRMPGGDRGHDHEHEHEHPHHPHPPPGKRPHKRPGCGHGHHGHHGHHHHHDFTHNTIYENLEKSNYTKKLFALISKDEALTKALNSTSANFTLFAPIDEAFEKIPKHGKHPSKEFIKDLLRYHATTGIYDAKKVLISHTIPTLFEDKGIEGENQRIRSRFGRINLFSKLKAVNIFSKNGVVHAIDTILVPPPPAAKVLELLPGQFSTLVNALYKTGLIEGIASNETYGTIFAPSNDAFRRLGPKILAFLFSKYGEKYLKALLEYHIVPGQMLYSDAWVKPDADGVLGHHDFPKGKFHADLPTLLEGRSLSVDVARWGPFIEIHIDGFTRVAFQDAIVKDGVVHVPGSVLIPPRHKPPTSASASDRYISVEELKERLEPYICH